MELEAEEGAFAAHGPRLGPLFVEMMPQQIIKLFPGAKAADVPVERPTKFELAINLKTSAAAPKPNGGLIVTPSSLAFVHRQLIIALAARLRLPAIHPFPPFRQQW
jgi:hypothetical protein